MATFSMPPFPLADIAVVTVSYRSGNVLPGFLESVSAGESGPTRIVVADNCPDDTSDIRSIVERAGAEYLALDRNLGYGGAINAAVRALPKSIQWIVVTNPDVVFHRGSIGALRKRAESDPRIAAVGPTIVTADLHVYPSAREIPSLRNGVGHAAFGHFWPGNPWTRSYQQRGSDATESRDAGWLSGACMLVRRDAFEAVDGFDEGYFMYFEDVDLGYRLGRAGFRNVFEPAAAVTHTGAHATSSEAASMIVAHHASARRFLNRKYRGPFLWPIRAAVTIGLAARVRFIDKLRGRGSRT